MAPQINSSIQDLPNMFEDLLTDSSLSTESMMRPYEVNADIKTASEIIIIF